MDAHPEAGMAGPLILNPDGSEQAGLPARRAHPVAVAGADPGPRPPLPRTAVFDDFVLAGQPLPAGPAPVEAISGAFMLVRRQALDGVGALDEGYFLHCEDLDWCMRFREAGHQVLFVPDVAVVHHKGALQPRPSRARVVAHAPRDDPLLRKVLPRPLPAAR